MSHQFSHLNTVSNGYPVRYSMNGEYRIVHKQSYFLVLRCKESSVKETRFENGVETVKPMSQVFHNISASDTIESSEFAVLGHEGKGFYRCDIECGFQRWVGSKHTNSIRRAFINCNFDLADMKWAMAEVRKTAA